VSLTPAAPRAQVWGSSTSAVAGELDPGRPAVTSAGELWP
jgi:hypothetical protein